MRVVSWWVLSFLTASPFWFWGCFNCECILPGNCPLSSFLYWNGKEPSMSGRNERREDSQEIKHVPALGGDIIITIQTGEGITSSYVRIPYHMNKHAILPKVPTSLNISGSNSIPTTGTNEIIWNVCTWLVYSIRSSKVVFNNIRFPAFMLYWLARTWATFQLIRLLFHYISGNLKGRIPRLCISCLIRIIL